MSELLELEKNGDLTGLMTLLRERVIRDRRTLTNPHAKAWCARRWRFLFLEEAVKDPIALEYASKRLDKRPAKQRIAEQYLVDDARTTWKAEQPAPKHSEIANTTLVFCPGLLNGMLPVRAFESNLPDLAKNFAMRVVRSDSHPMRSCEENMTDILQVFEHGAGRDAGGTTIEKNNQEKPGKAMVIAYSKGAPDFLTALSKYPVLGERTSCLFSWAGAVLGSEASDNIIDAVKGTLSDHHITTMSRIIKRLTPSFLKIHSSLTSRLSEADTLGAARSLSTTERVASMRANKQKLDELGIPMFYVRGAARRADVPRIQRKNFRDLSKFDSMNDMQLTTVRTAIPLPMGIDLGIVRAHHWDLAYPAFHSRKWWNNMYHPFPKTAALVAMVQLANELGLAD